MGRKQAISALPYLYSGQRNLIILLLLQQMITRLKSKMSSLERLQKKILGSEKIFVPKKILFPNNFVSKKFWLEKNILSKKKFGPKNTFESKKILSPKNIFGPKNILVKKKLGSE